MSDAKPTRSGDRVSKLAPVEADIARYERVPRTPQTLSPSYRLAFVDEDFMRSDAMRGARLQLEYQKSEAILAEAGLSYLGLGTQPPNPSWGKMLNEAQTFMYLAPHLAIFPGVAIVLTVLGLNLLGDGLRDVLDPRLRRSR